MAGLGNQVNAGALAGGPLALCLACERETTPDWFPVRRRRAVDISLNVSPWCDFRSRVEPAPAPTPTPE